MKKRKSPSRRKRDPRVKMTVRVPLRTKKEYEEFCRSLGISISEKARQDMENAVSQKRSGNYLPLGVVSWGVGKESLKMHVARSGRESIVMIVEGAILYELLEFLERMGTRKSRNRLLKSFLETYFRRSVDVSSNEDDTPVVRRKARSTRGGKGGRRRK